MRKTKCLILTTFIVAILLIIPNMSNAAVTVNREIMSNDGSMNFIIKGLTLETNKEYEFGLVETKATTPTKWFQIFQYDNNSATVSISRAAGELRSVIDKVDKGYIKIREKGSNSVVLEAAEVDLKMPLLRVSQYAVLANGKDLRDYVQIALRNHKDSTAYYQYEKITDENLISKYKEIKKVNGNFLELENLIKSDVPQNGYIQWKYWTGPVSFDIGRGYGYPQSYVSVPGEGLYYMWLYFASSNIKPVYGCILVDNLQKEILLDGISIPKTAEVELGKTIKLSPTFNPENATNKIVTWKSSDESVATVDNAGNVTPKKIGSTIITVTSKDGNKEANCTVTVTEKKNIKPNENTDIKPDNKPTPKPSEKPVDSPKPTVKPTEDNTQASGKLPQTGVGITLTLLVMAALGIGIISLVRYNKYKDV